MNTSETSGKTVELVRTTDGNLIMREIDPRIIENVGKGIKGRILTCLDDNGMIELRKLLENEKELGAGFLYQLTDSPFWKTLEIKSGDFLACIGGAIFFDTEAKGKRSANVTLDGGTSSQVDVRIKRSFVGLWLFSGALSPEAEKHILDTVLDLSDEAKIDDELIKADFDNFYFAEILEPNTNATHPYCFSLELDEEGNTELSEMQAELLLKAKEEQDYNGENPLIILSKDKRL